MRARGRAPLQHLAAQFEAVVAVEAAREQARIGLRDRLLGIELAFGEAVASAPVVDEAFAFLQPLDDAADAVHAHAVAGAEGCAQQRAAADGVVAQRARAGEHQLHLPAGEAHHGTQSEFGLRAAEPALSWAEHLV